MTAHNQNDPSAQLGTCDLLKSQHERDDNCSNWKPSAPAAQPAMCSECKRHWPSTQEDEVARDYVAQHFEFSEGCTLIRRESLISCLTDFAKGVQDGRYK